MEYDKLLCSIIAYLPDKVVSSLFDNTQHEFSDHVHFKYESYKTPSSRKYFNGYQKGNFSGYAREHDYTHYRGNRYSTGYTHGYTRDYNRPYNHSHNRIYQVGSNNELTTIKTDLVNLAKTTQPGSYYNDIVVPVNIGAFRENLLKMSNLARQDPDYRKKHGEKIAIDLSGDKTAEGEIIYKSSQTPPYFVDLVINDKLNQAAQLQAEYLASSNNKGGTGKGDPHIGPGPNDPYQGHSLEGLGDRLQYFGYSSPGGQGEGITSWYSGEEHQGMEPFMQHDTHFRPFFNVGTDTREIGFGVAQDKNGLWSVVFVAGSIAPKPY